MITAYRSDVENNCAKKVKTQMVIAPKKETIMMIAPNIYDMKMIAPNSLTLVHDGAIKLRHGALLRHKDQTRRMIAPNTSDTEHDRAK